MAAPEGRAWQVAPSRAALAWVARSVGPAARLRAVHRLGSGIAQATHAVTLDDAAGRHHRLVLQRWIRPNWEAEDPGFDPAKEAAVLAALADGPIPVPSVVGLDGDGAASGAPALLTERMPGRPPSDTLVRRPDVLDELGSTLAEIHRVAEVRATPALRTVVPSYYPFGDLAAATVPAASRDPRRWQEALEIAAEPLPEGRPETLLHRDYHAGNTLWLRGRLTGVVDWSSASWGPPAADLAHLQVDLCVDISVDAAVRAGQAYARAGGDLTDVRHHQARTVFDYLSDADPGWLTSGAIERLDRFLDLIVDRGPDG